jgi:hypothetical protein
VKVAALPRKDRVAWDTSVSDGWELGGAEACSPGDRAPLAGGVLAGAVRGLLPRAPCGAGSSCCAAMEDASCHLPGMLPAAHAVWGCRPLGDPGLALGPAAAAAAALGSLFLPRCSRSRRKSAVLRLRGGQADLLPLAPPAAEDGLRGTALSAVPDSCCTRRLAAALVASAAAAWWLLAAVLLAAGVEAAVGAPELGCLHGRGMHVAWLVPGSGWGSEGLSGPPARPRMPSEESRATSSSSVTRCVFATCKARPRSTFGVHLMQPL